MGILSIFFLCFITYRLPASDNNLLQSSWIKISCDWCERYFDEHLKINDSNKKNLYQIQITTVSFSVWCKLHFKVECSLFDYFFLIPALSFEVGVIWKRSCDIFTVFRRLFYGKDFRWNHLNFNAKKRKLIG